MICVRVVVGLLALSAVASLQAADGYYRQPAIHGDTVVFTAEGDLWSVPISSGQARRLTTHPALENRAAISPDGRWLAFSAAYEGPVEAYVMPLAGGQPQRISFENGQALVLGWADDAVLYSSAHAVGSSSLRVVTAVVPDSLERLVWPFADINDAALATAGGQRYLIRFGLAVTGDNARGYRGGALSQLWQARGEDARRIGPVDANIRRPMVWQGGRLIVISDQAGRDNLWSLDADGGDAKVLTRHRDFDVRWASLHGDRVVYQHGADLRVFDLEDGSDRTLAISLVSDFDQRRERWLSDPLRYLESARLSPDGEHVAMTARGRVVLAGPGPRRRVEITAPAGSRLSAAVLSPDGRQVYAICDATGEEEVWQFPADGSPGGKALTNDGDSQRWQLYPSPDGRWLAHDDKHGRLHVLDLSSGSDRVIDEGGPDGNEAYATVTWAPDSRHLAFARQTASSGRNRIGLYSLTERQRTWLTSDKYESYAPSFSPDGRWLWFLSEREFKLANGAPWGDRNTGPYFDKRSKVYALALQDDARFPFLPIDELADAGETADKDEADDAAALPAVALDGLAQRLYEVPLAAGNYVDLQAGRNRLFLLERNGDKNALKYLPIASNGASASELHADTSEFALSADRRHLLIRKPGKGEDDFGAFYLTAVVDKLPDDLSKITVRLSDWSLRVQPPLEWAQMFADAWRMHRDHFYDAALRGIDWTAVRARYQPLLARVSERDELDDLLAQMMAELGALHSQVVGGDERSAKDGAKAASLGGRYRRVESGWQVEHIYRTEAELPNERAPLQAPGVDVRVGDVIVAVNGQPSGAARHLSDLLRNQAGQQVLLSVRRGNAAARNVVVVPVDAAREERLRYGDWVQGNRETVEQAGDGAIGYLHLFAMTGNDIASFVREFYGQYERAGLIIDVRRNRGGNIDSWVIEKLLRRAWAFWQRPVGLPYANMQQTFRGHLVVLTDALTYSDGETFAAGIKSLGLGPLIGTRTAGAGVWLSDGNALVDRGRARVAEFPQYGVDGAWLIEGRGVEPDIVVDNPPHASFRGADAQLQAGITWLQRKLEAEPLRPLRPGQIPPLLRPEPTDTP